MEWGGLEYNVSTACGVNPFGERCILLEVSEMGGPFPAGSNGFSSATLTAAPGADQPTNLSSRLVHLAPSFQAPYLPAHTADTTSTSAQADSFMRRAVAAEMQSCGN